MGIKLDAFSGSGNLKAGASHSLQVVHALPSLSQAVIFRFQRHIVYSTFLRNRRIPERRPRSVSELPESPQLLHRSSRETARYGISKVSGSSQPSARFVRVFALWFPFDHPFPGESSGRYNFLLIVARYFFCLGINLLSMKWRSEER